MLSRWFFSSPQEFSKANVTAIETQDRGVRFRPDLKFGELCCGSATMRDDAFVATIRKRALLIYLSCASLPMSAGAPVAFGRFEP